MLSKKDYVIVAGDFGFQDFKQEDSYWLKWFQQRGQVFDFDGVKIFTFGGAKSKGIERK